MKNHTVMRDVTPDIDKKQDLFQDILPFLPEDFSVVMFAQDHIKEMNISGLEKICRPSSADRAFKLIFWERLEVCLNEQRQMSELEARCNILSKRGLVRFTDTVPLLVWLLTPEIPVDVMNKVKLMEVMDRLSIITEYSAIGGEIPEDIDYKFLAVQMKMYEMLDKRINGDFLQKIEEKSMRIHMTKKDPQVATQKVLSAEDKIKQLEARISQASDLGGSGLKKEDSNG